MRIRNVIMAALAAIVMLLGIGVPAATAVVAPTELKSEVRTARLVGGTTTMISPAGLVVPMNLNPGSWWSQTYHRGPLASGGYVDMRFSYYNRQNSCCVYQRVTGAQVFNNTTQGQIRTLQLKAYYIGGLGQQVIDWDTTRTINAWNTTQTYSSIPERNQDMKPTVDVEVQFYNGWVIRITGARLRTQP